MLDDAKQRASGLRICAAASGILFGSLGFVTWKYFGLEGFSQAAALRLVAVIFATALAAGLCSVIAFPFARLPKASMTSFAMQNGLLSGLLAALLAGAAVVVESVLQTLGATSHAMDVSGQALSWHFCFILLAAFFTSAPAGVFGAMLGLFFRAPQTGRKVGGLLIGAASSSIREKLPSGDPSIWVTRTLLVVGMLGLGSPLIFLVQQPKVDPPPPQPVLPPPPPPFLYEKPRSFDYAEPNQFVVAFRKSIPTVAADRPMLFSSDSKLFAYCPANTARGSVAVWNLDSFKLVASYSLPTQPSQLAWSPDMNRLFYVSDGRMGIFDLQVGNSVELPRPKNRDVPESRPNWWLADHVAFFPSDEPPLELDLKTLLIERLERASTFPARQSDTSKPKTDSLLTDLKVASGISNSNTAERLCPEFPKKAGWQMMVDACIRGVESPPRRQPAGPWNISGFPTLAFKGMGAEVVRWVGQLDLTPGSLLLPAPDGTKLILHNGGQTEVIYFGTREPVSSVVSVAMPISREKKKDDTELASLIKDHRLCAFAYAPMINPLTHETVGPDRDHLRAILRLAKWEAESADFWAAEQFGDLQEGDVVADLHSWDRGNIEMQKDYVESIWWTPVSKLRRDPDTIPTPVSAQELDKGISISISTTSYAFQFQNANRSTQPKAYRAPVTESPPTEKMQAPGPPPVVDPPKPEIPRDEIEKFVFRHHQFASEPNIGALVQDYDDFVKFLGQSKTREEIRKDELDYHQKWTRVVETPQRPIVFTKDWPWFVATYTVDFRTESPSENRWVSGKNDISLSLKSTREGFLIVSQTAKIRDRQEGTLHAVAVPQSAPAPVLKKGPPPAVAITVPKPCWTTTLPNDQNPFIDMTDAVNIQGNSFTLHRTFRLFNEFGQVLRSCRFQYHGRVARQGNMLSLFMDEFSWGNGSDKELGNALLPDSDRADGSALNFAIDGNNLVVPGFGKVLHPVR
jgi:hypothetical protein